MADVTQVSESSGLRRNFRDNTAHLERDLRALFPQHPRWRVAKNRRSKQALNEIDSAIWQLRLDSRHSAEGAA